MIQDNSGQDLAQVESPELWQCFPRITLVIKCLPDWGKVKYPFGMMVVTVDVHRLGSVDGCFNKAMDAAAAVVAKGDDTLVHCRQAFHRAPIVAAAVMRRMAGVGVLERSAYLNLLMGCLLSSCSLRHVSRQASVSLYLCL